MKEVKIISIDEIIRIAFYTYRFMSKKSMNTYIISQIKKYNNILTDEQIEKIYSTLEIKIKEYEEMKKQKADKEMQKEIENIIKLKVI